MNFIARILAFFLLIPFWAVASAPVIKNFSDLVSDLDSYTEATRKDWNIPGIAVVIVHQGKTYYILKGSQSISDPTPLSTHTRFQVMSLTKGITAVVLAKLAQQGVLSFNDPLIKYIPDFKLSDPTATKTLTIGNVLSQSVGLRHFAGDTFLKLGFSEKELRTILAQLPVQKTPGKFYTYSNQFPGLMRQLVEKVTGKSFEKVAQELVFKPLGMNASSYEPQQGKGGLLAGCSGGNKLPNDFAKPHAVQGNIVELPAIEQAYIYPTSMGISSSVEDMGKWLQFCLYNTGELLNHQWFTTMRTPQNHYVTQAKNSYIFPKSRMTDLGYCFGIMQSPYGKDRKVKLYTHNGAWTGGTARIAYVPELDVGIIVLCNLGANTDCMAPEALAFKFLDSVMDINDTDWHQIIWQDTTKRNLKYRRSFEQEKYLTPHPHEDITPYLGTYKNALYGAITLKIKDNALWMAYRKKWVKLTHVNGNRFKFEAYQLAEGFSSSYYAYIDIGHHRGLNVQALTCNLMYEGDDTVFIKATA